MKDSKVITDFWNNLKPHYENMMWFKVPDGIRTGDKPFDVIASFKGLHIAMEFKRMQTWAKKDTVFYIREMKFHQIDWLEQARDNGKWAIVICKFFRGKTYWWDVDVIRKYWDRQENVPVELGHEWNHKIIEEKRKEYANIRFSE